MSVRVITQAEIDEENRTRRCRCSKCKVWLRYYDTDVCFEFCKPGSSRRYVVCPACGFSRTIGLVDDGQPMPVELS